jgi:phage shock protein PspC (stress-responsive transcriptional regulator)
MKRLFRDRSNRMVGGVASGLAQYLDVDPVLVRVGFVLGAFANGIGILGYLILWVLVPQRPYAYDLYPESSVVDADPPAPARRTSHNAGMIFGITLVVIGALTLIDNLFDVIDLDQLWPIVLIAMGAGLIARTVSTRQTMPTAQPFTAPEEPRSYSSPLQ